VKKRYSSSAVTLGNMTPDMSKGQKDAVERSTDAQIERHFKSHKELPPGKNFMCWNKQHDPPAEKKYRDNFDKIFPRSPGHGF